MRREKEGLFERAFEGVMWKFRLLVLIVVIGLLIASLVGFYLGAHSLFEGIRVLMASSATKSDVVIVYLISALDEFLLGIVLVIFAFGIYELFISKIDLLEEDRFIGSRWLKFNSLEELKTVLVKVLIIILIVYFFKKVIVMEFATPLSVVLLAGSILLLAVAQYLSHSKGLGAKKE